MLFCFYNMSFGGLFVKKPTVKQYYTYGCKYYACKNRRKSRPQKNIIIYRR